MHDLQSLTLIIDIAIIITASFLIGFIAHKFKQSVVLAYIFAGVLIGPYGFQLIKNLNEVNALAEMGVALLMFVKGVELNFPKLKTIWKISILGSAVQVVVMISLGFSLSKYLGWSTYNSLLLGMILAISSTMTVMKILMERGEMYSLHGRITAGFVIVQDLMVVMMIFFISNFEAIKEGSLRNLLMTIVGSLLLVSFIVYVGRMVLPKVLTYIIKSSNREMFLLSIFALAIGIPLSTYALGLTVALGAFIAGFMLSEAKYSAEISVQMQPFRDIFVVIFFVSMGMLINPMLLFSEIPLVLGLILLVLLGKFTTSLVTIKLFGYSVETSAKVALLIMQIGEFSFILLTVGQMYGQVSHELSSSVIAVTLITILMTPFFARRAGYACKIINKLPFVKYLSEGKPVQSYREYPETKLNLKGHTIICGYGRTGSYLAKELKEKGDILIIEHDPRKIDEIKKIGCHYIYGDAVSPEILKMANVDEASILILALPDMRTKQIAIRFAKECNPNVFIISRAFDIVESKEWEKIGADRTTVPHLIEAAEMLRMIQEKLSLKS